MSGNCATGRTWSEITPAMTMTVEMTKASRGRRMKTDEIVMGLLLCRRGRRVRRRHGHAGVDPLLALDDDLFARLEALADGDQAVAHDAGLDPPLLDDVLVAQHEQRGAALVDRDRRLRHGDHGRNVG